MEEAISRILTELEEIRHFFDNPTNPNPQYLSESTLLDLQTLLRRATNSNDSEPLDSFFEDLSSKSLSPNHLVLPISSTMDLGPTHLSLLASNVYLSLLLSPNSPVFTLFTPMSFLSLLRSIRRYLKPRPRGTSETGEGSHNVVANRKRKGGNGGRGRGKGSRNNAKSLGVDDGESEESEFDVGKLFSVLEKLELVMGLIHLDRFPDSLKSLVQRVVEIPVMAVEVCGNSVSYNRITDLCSRVLSEVLRPEHGEQADTAAEVLKSLSPLILRFKSPERAFGLGFVMHRMMGVAKSSDGVKKAVVNLPRYLVQKAPEKTELRALAVESIMEIVKVMEFNDQIGLWSMLLGVDLILMLMMSLDGEVKSEWGFRYMEALIQRCSDTSGGIRARALYNLAQLVGFLIGDDRSRDMLKEVMGFGNVAEERRVEADINGLLRKRCMDEKAAVRKATFLLITNLTALLGGAFDEVVLKTIGMACSDPFVSIRKAAISALSEAFRKFSDESVTTEWLHSVPRLITDNESSIQEECENLFLELVLDRISGAALTGFFQNGSVLSDSSLKAKSSEREMESLFPEGVLALLRGICNGEVTPWVKKICASLGKKKQLKHKIILALQNIIKTSESLWLRQSMLIEKWTAPPGAWFLLSEVSAYLLKAVDWEFLHHHWQLFEKHGVRGEVKIPLAQGDAHAEEEGIESNSVAWAGDRVFLLQTISNVSTELPPEPAADLAHNLLKRIEEFNMHSTEVNAHKASNPEEADSLVMRWVDQLLSKAYHILEKYVLEVSEAKQDGCFFTPPSRKGKKAARLLSKAVTAVSTIGSLVIVCPSADVSAITPLLHTIITSGNSDPKLNKLPGPSVSLKQTAPPLYIQAWLTMGKICLVDGKLAKNYIPLFVQELEKSDCAALHNNLVVMMADFCVQYTALVDCYIAKITKCLCDPCELVRRQTFILLSRLLQRDYVKWRGVLFLRFLLSLVDESEKIRQLADYLFGSILKVKAPLLAYNSFVEAIFILNDCDAHNGHTDSQGSRVESWIFSNRGSDENSRSKRMHIYVSLLKQMAPEHLLATFAKLCAEILAAASDGMLDT
ncbi:hypothetical protein ACB098_02G018800 [Castanea mollissima]